MYELESQCATLPSVLPDDISTNHSTIRKDSKGHRVQIIVLLGEGKIMLIFLVLLDPRKQSFGDGFRGTSPCEQRYVRRPGTLCDPANDSPSKYVWFNVVHAWVYHGLPYDLRALPKARGDDMV